MDRAMDLHLPRRYLPHWERRETDWPAAVAAGLVAGAVLMVVELVWSVTLGSGNPWRTPHLIAGILLGASALQSFEFTIGVVVAGLATHYLLGVGFAAVLSVIIAGFAWESSVAATQLLGAAFGLVLYLINFYGMVHVFPWMAELRGWPTIVAHVLFGMVAAWTYWKLSRRNGDR
jgi:hypothetical protein